ncbi:pilin [Patescibacteria group bacterium]|nr:pilin [Patescibacteria group bacterium]
MFKKRIIILTVFLLLFLLTGSVLAKDYGLKATQKAAGLSDAGSVPVIVGNVLGSVLSLVGVLFFALMLYGGIVWMMARGNQEDEKKALSTITAAIIGIVIVVSSYAITNFVFEGMKGNVGGTPKEIDKLDDSGLQGDCVPITVSQDLIKFCLNLGMLPDAQVSDCETFGEDLCISGNYSCNPTVNTVAEYCKKQSVADCAEKPSESFPVCQLEIK